MPLLQFVKNAGEKLIPSTTGGDPEAAQAAADPIKT
jgi:hypothetical protein